MPENGTVEPAQEEAKQAEIKYVMPSLENGCAVMYDTDKHASWVGIPLEQINNPVMVMALLDRAKYEIMQHINKFMEEKLRAEQLRLHPPEDAPKNLNGAIKQLLKTGKSLWRGESNA